MTTCNLIEVELLLIALPVAAASDNAHWLESPAPSVLEARLIGLPGTCRWEANSLNSYTGWLNQREAGREAFPCRDGRQVPRWEAANSPEMLLLVA